MITQLTEARLSVKCQLLVAAKDASLARICADCRIWSFLAPPPPPSRISCPSAFLPWLRPVTVIAKKTAASCLESWGIDEQLRAYKAIDSTVPQTLAPSCPETGVPSDVA